MRSTLQGHLDMGTGINQDKDAARVNPVLAGSRNVTFGLGVGRTKGRLASPRVRPQQVMKLQMLHRNILSDRAVLRTVQAGCFAAAALIPTLAFHKFAEVDLSRAVLLVGVLSALALAFLSTVLGVFLEIRMREVQGTPEALD